MTCRYQFERNEYIGGLEASRRELKRGLAERTAKLS